MKLSIVSYLDPDTTRQVRELQKTLSDLTGSIAALTSWSPHITLGDGVEVDDTDTLVAELTQIANSTNSFDLKVSGFSSIDSRPIGRGEISTPYVIYIDVVPNQALLDLVQKIGRVTNEYETWYLMHRPYLPHVTLAFRDLTKDGYEKGLEYLKDKDVELVSKIDHIALVEKLDEVDREYKRILLASV